MGLLDITPADVIGETNQAKSLASAILALAAYVDAHADELWVEYGKAWASMTNARKNEVITQLCATAGVAVSTALLGWIREFINLLIGDRYAVELLAKLTAQETTLVAKLEAVRAQIAELGG
jgi:hypothetical protein